MSDTKACNLTEKEVMTLIAATMQQTLNSPKEDLDLDHIIERINYLNKRLKTFKEVEYKSGFAEAAAMTPDDNITADTDALNPNNQQIKETANTGWPTNG